MSALIKYSYEDETELLRILERLGDYVAAWKRSGNQKGRYKKAYIKIIIK